MNSLFTYGTLMDSDVFALVTGVSRQGNNAMLPGYRRYTVIGESYPAIVPSENETVDGVLYDDLSDESIKKLDQFEGDEYLRIQGSAFVGNIFKTVWVYEYNQKYVSNVSSEPWSFTHFVENEKEAFLKLCKQTVCVNSRNSKNNIQ